MKKMLASITAAVFAIAVPAALPGCAKRSESFESLESNISDINGITGSEASEPPINVDKTPITVVRDTFDEEIAALKATKYDNISYENLKNYSFPNVSEITTYKVVKHTYDGTDLTPEQFFENFVIYCEYLEPGKYSRDDIAEKVGIWGSFEQNPEAPCPNYNEFKALNKNGNLKIHHIWFETPDIYLAYTGDGCPFWYESNAVKKLDKIDSEQSPVFFGLVNKKRPIIDYTENIDSTEVYHLADGDISIADAAKRLNEMLANIVKQCDDGEAAQEACAVKVVDMGDGSYAFIFTTTPVVDGIKYAFADMRGDVGGVGYFLDETDGDGCGVWDQAEMIKSDSLAMYKVSGGWKERTPVDVHTSIVPLKTAAENAAKLLSGEMKFKAKSVSLVYDVKGGTDDLVPCWRFVLENSNPEKYYHVYVNAIDGTARVKAIQEVNSGQQFD